MIIAPDSHTEQTILERLKQWQPRENIHLTDLVFCLRRSFFRRRVNIPPTDHEVLLWLSGRAHHGLLEPQVREVKLERDGIIGTADGIELVDRTVIIQEVKTTRSSSKHSVLEQKHWLVQGMGYCSLAGADILVLIVLHLLGNWRPPFPELRAWRITFTKNELEDNWCYLLARRDILVDSLERGIAPDFRHHYNFECKSCALADACSNLNMVYVGER